MELLAERVTRLEAQRRSELAWVCEVATELRSGALPWAAGFGPTTEEDT